MSDSSDSEIDFEMPEDDLVAPAPQRNPGLIRIRGNQAMEARQAEAYGLIRMRGNQAMEARQAEAYSRYSEWKLANGIELTTDAALLQYFQFLVPNLSMSAMWTEYSSLTRTIYRNENVEIALFQDLRKFLRETNRGFPPKQVETFTTTDIQRFLTEAPDVEYLDAKVALILGIAGGCNIPELMRIILPYIRTDGSSMNITLASTKSELGRTFFVPDPWNSTGLMGIIERFICLRPAHLQRTGVLFMDYQDGVIRPRVTPMEKMRQMPKRIATWLGKADLELYTNRSFRLTLISTLRDAAEMMAA